MNSQASPIICLALTFTLAGCVANHSVMDVLEREPVYVLEIKNDQEIAAECISSYLAINDISQAQPSVHRSNEDYLIIGRTHWGPIYVIRVSPVDVTGHLSGALFLKSDAAKTLATAMTECRQSER